MEPLSQTSISAVLDPAIFAAMVPFAIRATGALLIVSMTLVVAGRVRRATMGSLGRTRANPNISMFIGRLAHMGALAIGALIALGIAGIDWTALLAVAGAISLAISLATQDVLKSFVAGLYLLMERPFVVGETIKVKEFTGRVEDIGIRTTVLRTNDDLRVVVPNTVLFTDVVMNLSTGGVEKVGAESSYQSTPRRSEPEPHADVAGCQNPEG